MTINSSFLYERRIEAGLSQSDVANALGYSVQLVSMWESGKNAPLLHVLGKYASLLQIDLEGIIYSKVIKKNNLCDELTFNAVEFGNNIKRLRKKKNLTQKQLADSLSCNVNQLIKYEKGSSFPTIDQFISLAKLFKVRLDVLYFCLNYQPEDVQKEKKKTRTLLIVVPIIVGISTSALTLGITLAATSGLRNKQQVIVVEQPSSNSDSKPTNNIKWTLPNDVTHTLGSYPQSLVEDTTTINALNTIGTTNENGYVLYNNEYYEKVVAKVTAPTVEQIGFGAINDIKFNNGQSVINHQTYWFKVEPIKWRKMGEFDNGDIVLLSNVTIDAGLIFDTESNVYKDSFLRTWLNSDFIDKAFGEDKQQLVQADLYNRSIVDYVSILYLDIWPAVLVESSEYARSKGTIGSNKNQLFSWCLGPEHEPAPFEEIDTTKTSALVDIACSCGDADVNDPSYGGIIPIIVIKDNK